MSFWRARPGTRPISESRIALALAATIGIPAILFVVFYIWNFIHVPAQLDKDEQQTINDLTQKLDDREVFKKIRQSLWELREQGVKIRNDGLTTRTTVSWVEKFDAWHARVLDQANKLSADLRHSLDPIDKIAPESDDPSRSTMFCIKRMFLQCQKCWPAFTNIWTGRVSHHYRRTPSISRNCRRQSEAVGFGEQVGSTSLSGEITNSHSIISLQKQQCTTSEGKAMGRISPKKIS